MFYVFLATHLWLFKISVWYLVHQNINFEIWSHLSWDLCNYMKPNLKDTLQYYHVVIWGLFLREWFRLNIFSITPYIWPFYHLKHRDSKKILVDGRAEGSNHKHKPKKILFSLKIFFFDNSFFYLRTPFFSFEKGLKS